ncbi:unnamed protein product [Musa banksii]
MGSNGQGDDESSSRIRLGMPWTLITTRIGRGNMTRQRMIEIEASTTRDDRSNTMGQLGEGDSRYK